jgi:hypothetical protein
MFRIESSSIRLKTKMEIIMNKKILSLLFILGTVTASTWAAGLMVSHAALGLLPQRTPIATQNIETQTEDVHTNEFQCVICFDNVNPGQEITATECNHLFHKKCLNGWTSGHTTCPSCRTEVETKDALINELDRCKNKFVVTEQGLELQEISQLILIAGLTYGLIQKYELSNLTTGALCTGSAFLHGTMKHFNQILSQPPEEISEVLETLSRNNINLNESIIHARYLANTLEGITYGADAALKVNLAIYARNFLSSNS